MVKYNADVIKLMFQNWSVNGTFKKLAEEGVEANEVPEEFQMMYYKWLEENDYYKDLASICFEDEIEEDTVTITRKEYEELMSIKSEVERLGNLVMQLGGWK